MTRTRFPVVLGFSFFALTSWRLCRVVTHPCVVLDDVVGCAIAGRSRRCRRGVGGGGLNVLILPQGVLAKVTWTSQDGRMGRYDRRSRRFERYTEAESTGEATGDTAVATTGVAMTTAARCMAKDGVHASRARKYGRKNKNRIGTVHDLRARGGVIRTLVRVYPVPQCHLRSGNAKLLQIVY